MNVLPLLLALLWSTTAPGADAPPATSYDRVDLSASVQGEAANDIVAATLYKEAQGADAAALAAQVNRAVAAAVDRAKQVPGLKVQTLNYETYPVNNDKGQFTGWRVRQTIRLETADVAQLTALLGELQQTLNLDSIQYSVSPESLKKVEDALIGDALQAFQQRAELVTHDLGRSKYRIVSLRVDTNPQPPIVYRQAAVAAMAAPAPPAIEPGTGKVDVVVNGQIELQPQ